MLLRSIATTSADFKLPWVLIAVVGVLLLYNLSVCTLALCSYCKYKKDKLHFYQTFYSNIVRLEEAGYRFFSLGITKLWSTAMVKHTGQDIDGLEYLV